jgi:hypothetical protein
MRTILSLSVALFGCGFAVLGLAASSQGAEAEYVGGTIATLPSGADGNLVTTNEKVLVFLSRGSHVQVAYDQINMLEYGQKVDRRYVMAVVLSPMFLLSKKRQHFLTVGYSDEAGRQQALVFKVEKSMIRAVLVSLEARSGRKVQFQDEEARKAGKG